MPYPGPLHAVVDLFHGIEDGVQWKHTHERARKTVTLGDGLVSFAVVHVELDGKGGIIRVKGRQVELWVNYLEVGRRRDISRAYPALSRYLEAHLSRPLSNRTDADSLYVEEELETSSFMWGMLEYSCSTPSTLIQVIAVPSTELSSMRRIGFADGYSEATLEGLDGKLAVGVAGLKGLNFGAEWFSPELTRCPGYDGSFQHVHCYLE